jgi:mannose-1-phosphate guanylyltransferase
VVGNVLVAASAKIGADCKIGPDVSIGEGCVIGDGVRLSNCVVMKGVEVGKHTKVRHGVQCFAICSAAWCHTVPNMRRCVVERVAWDDACAEVTS